MKDNSKKNWNYQNPDNYYQNQQNQYYGQGQQANPASLSELNIGNQVGNYNVNDNNPYYKNQKQNYQNNYYQVNNNNYQDNNNYYQDNNNYYQDNSGYQQNFYNNNNYQNQYYQNKNAQNQNQYYSNQTNKFQQNTKVEENTGYNQNSKYNQNYNQQGGYYNNKQNTYEKTQEVELDHTNDNSYVSYNSNYRGNKGQRGNRGNYRGRGGRGGKNNYNYNEYEQPKQTEFEKFEKQENKGYTNKKEYNDYEDVYDDQEEEFNDEYLEDGGYEDEPLDENFDDLAEDFDNLGVQNTKKKNKKELIFSDKLGFTAFVDGKLNKSRKPINDSHINVLMIAEKPSIAQAIAFAISNGKNVKQRKGKYKVLEFEGYFKDVKANFTVSSVMGHVLSTDFQSIHNDWNALDPVDLFNIDICKLEANPKSRVCSQLGFLAKGKDVICLWLDCDKEGENICYETLHSTFERMNRKNYQQIYRAKFSSLTPQDLRNAFNNLAYLPNSLESLSVDARQVIDLKIGVAFTRFLTSNVLPALNENLNPDNRLKVLSYGPCQTPTLWFCVDRHNEIASFKPKQYYKLYADVEISRLRYKIFYNTKIWDKSQVNNLLNKIRKDKQAKVAKIETLVKNKQAPAGLNTVSLLRASSSYLKISPSETMHIAEKLYTSGYTTYPRTETTKYASGFDFAKILNEFAKSDTTFSKSSAALVKTFIVPHRGVDVGDHPPITPTNKVPKSGDLKGNYLRVYEFICNQFLASLCPGAQYEERKYHIDIGGEVFIQEASHITQEGFLKLMSWKKGNYSKDFPKLQENQVLKIDSSNYEMRETEPPEHLSESELLKLMEKSKIGTDASMAVHMQNIADRKYVTINEARRIKPTKLGIALVESLSLVDKDLVIPNVRAEIETFVDLVAKGNKSYAEVLDYALNLFKTKFINLRKFYDKIIQNFKKYFKMDSDFLIKRQKLIESKNDKLRETKKIDVNKIETFVKDCESCNKGRQWLDYDIAEKILLRCTGCTLKKKVLRDTIEYKINPRINCKKCSANYIWVMVENPFLSGENTYEGCMFCDSNLN